MNQIKQRKQEYPHDIDEMPVEPGDLDGMRNVVAMRRAEPQPAQESDAGGHVQRVQAGHREVEAEEQLRLRVRELVGEVRAGHEVVLIGHKGHPEVEGTMGQYRCSADGAGIYLVETPDDVANLEIRNPTELAFVTQTTLSMDDTARVIEALQRRFPDIKGPKKDDICYATQNRQDAVTRLAQQCDLVLVVGSPNSSNSNRLKEIAEKQQRQAYLIDGPEDIRRSWLDGVRRVGVTAGASAPEVLVGNVIRQLQAWGADPAEELAGERETVVFALPKNLLSAMDSGQTLDAGTDGQR